MRLRAYLAVLAAVLIWGASISVVKWFIGGESKLVASYLFVRFTIGWLAIEAASRWTRRGRSERTDQVAIVVPAAVCAGLCLGAGFLLQTDYLSASSSTSIDAAFLTATTVGWIPIFGLLFRRSIGWTEIAAVCLAIIGVLLISDIKPEQLADNALAVLGAVLFALQVVITSQYLTVKSIRWTKVTLLIPALVFGLLSVREFSRWGSMIDNKFIFVAIYTGVLSTAIAMYLENWALAQTDPSGGKLLSPAYAGVITAFEPFATVLVSFFLLSERATTLHFIGGLVVILANTLDPIKEMVRKKPGAK